MLTIQQYFLYIIYYSAILIYNNFFTNTPLTTYTTMALYICSASCRSSVVCSVHIASHTHSYGRYNNIQPYIALATIHRL